MQAEHKARTVKVGEISRLTFIRRFGV